MHTKDVHVSAEEIPSTRKGCCRCATPCTARVLNSATVRAKRRGKKWDFEGETPHPPRITSGVLFQRGREMLLLQHKAGVQRRRAVTGGRRRREGGGGGNLRHIKAARQHLWGPSQCVDREGG